MINFIRFQNCMKYLIIFSVLFFGFQSNAQEIKVIQVENLESLIHTNNEKIQIINFWATWCGPCVKELPYLESAGVKMSDVVDVHLVTVDFVEDLEKVKKFVERKQLKSNLYLIDNVDYNSWIDKVDKSWSGAIPATLILNPKSGKRKFLERELKEGELDSLINELL